MPSFLNQKKQKIKGLDIGRKNANAKSGRFFCIVPFRFHFSQNTSSQSQSQSQSQPVSSIAAADNNDDSQFFIDLTGEESSQPPDVTAKTEINANPPAEDVIGRLDSLNTETPVMYLNFPNKVSDLNQN